MVGEIQPARLTVRANDTNRVYGAENPAFTASYLGFVGAEGPEVLSGSPSFSTVANLSSLPEGGPYPIEVQAGTLSAANYVFDFQPAWLSILLATPQPARIQSIGRAMDGSMAVVYAGTPGQNYILQAAAELSPGAWKNVVTNRADASGEVLYSDAGAATAPSRFYRVILP
jgi:hypothetical protein